MEIVPGNEEVEGPALDIVEYEQLKSVLWPMVDSLPDDGGMVIRERYQNKKTLDAIGEQLGSSRERVRQIEAKALRVLRQPSKSNQLRPFAEEYIGTHAYRGCGAETFNRTRTSSTEWVALKLLEHEPVPFTSFY